jgi:hypothetical protein
VSIRRVGRGLLAVVLVAAAACSSGDDDGGGGGDGGGAPEGPVDAASVEDLMATLGTEVIAPAYDDLVAALEGLGTALDGWCAAPAAEAPEAARTAWATAADAWQRTRPVGVGPAMDRRLMSSVWYPARPEDVEELVAGAEPLTPEALDAGSATARGLGTVEILVFGSEGADPARRCAYAAAATTLATTAAAEVAADWDGYPETLAAGIDGDPQSSLAALVNELAHALQTVDDQGLRGIALAEAPDDVPETQRDGPAGHRVADLRALLATVQAVVDGPGGDDGLGALVADRSADTGERLDEALAAAAETVGVLPDSIPATLDVPDDLAAAAEDAAELKVVLSTEVASVLGVTIGFSDADGDS